MTAYLDDEEKNVWRIDYTFTVADRRAGWTKHYNEPGPEYLKDPPVTPRKPKGK